MSAVLRFSVNALGVMLSMDSDSVGVHHSGQKSSPSPLLSSPQLSPCVPIPFWEENHSGFVEPAVKFYETSSFAGLFPQFLWSVKMASVVLLFLWRPSEICCACIAG